MKTFGKNPSGYLTLCKAKPENRGKGNCNHSEHIDFTVDDLREGKLQKHNEEQALANGENTFKSLRKANGIPTRGKIRNTSGEISPEDLEKTSEEIANEISTKDFKFIQNFYDENSDLFSNAEVRKLEADADRIEPLYAILAKRISTRLNDDSEPSINMREFLGDEIDIDDLSEILVRHVGAMTAKRKYRGGDSISRVILSTLNNDMNRKRYMASVLFFGGRCCYCNRVLSRNPQGDSKLPTGEHLTPISPDDENAIVGGTRYGNMALACANCNKDRGSQELKTWIAQTQSIKKAYKPHAYARIKAFRQFTLYEEYTLEESQAIRESINEVNDFILTQKTKSGRLLNNAQPKINGKIAETLYKLGQTVKS